MYFITVNKIKLYIALQQQTKLNLIIVLHIKLQQTKLINKIIQSLLTQVIVMEKCKQNILVDELLNDITPMHKRIQLFLKKLKSQNTKSKKLRDTLQTVQSKINAIEEQIKK